MTFILVIILTTWGVNSGHIHVICQNELSRHALSTQYITVDVLLFPAAPMSSKSS